LVLLKGIKLKKIVLVIFLLLIAVGVYFYYKNNSNIRENEEKVSIKTSNELLSKVSDIEKKVDKKKLKKEKGFKQKDKVSKNDTDTLVTDSKELRALVDALKKDDWDAFDKVYNSKVKELRDGKDHSQFYDSFKSLFLENKLEYGNQIALLALLREANTKDSLNQLFELYDENIITDNDVKFDVARYMLDSVNRMVYEPSIDFESVVKTLKEEYEKTSVKPLKEALAMMIAKYEKNNPDTMVALFSSYINAKDDSTKNAAYKGLMHMDGDKLLPVLKDYLGSEYEIVHKTAGDILVNIGMSNAVDTINEWVISAATIENLPEIKAWYEEIMKTRGNERVVKSWDSKIDKIRDIELREEMKNFIASYE
jgi:Ca2+/Na+ antiporter